MSELNPKSINFSIPVEPKDKILEVPIFGAKIRMYVTDDMGEISKRYNLGNVDGYDAFTFPYNAEKYDIVAVFRTGLGLGIYVHEATHLANLVFRHISQKLDEDNDEVQAYLTQWLFEEIMKIANEKGANV